MSSEASSSERGRRARSFGNVADEYERGRPGYPLAAIEWLLGAEPLDVVDLGAGTGKLTRVLLAAGHRVRAIEPLAQMRAVLAASAPAALVLDGTAEQIPLADGSVDAVLAGSAFHWFDHERALAEAARVLRPPGVLGLLGNGFDDSLAWVARLRELLGSPRLGRHGHWPGQERLEEMFAEVQEREFAHEQPIDLAGLRDLAVSRSRIALMEPDERRALLGRLELLWQEHVGAERTTLTWRTRALRARGLRQAAAERPAASSRS